MTIAIVGTGVMDIVIAGRAPEAGAAKSVA